MIHVRPIKLHEWNPAKRLVYRVAHEVFKDTRPLAEAIAEHEARGELSDMDDIQNSYVESGGIFLVMVNGDKIICTGAIRRYAEGVCELKRLWLLQEHQGKGLGYRMIQELLPFAKEAGYQRIVLETDPIHQKRAIEFYKGLGFYEILIPNARPEEDIQMEMIL